ncbi:ANTAR domain-containing protein [Kribbella sp. NBC_01505]|uniref:ANTAR domain-containing protein n=1 Tax=Kribbella sp. NBC_01505 TaxID=2903580 RepID=UPI00386FB1E2
MGSDLVRVRMGAETSGVIGQAQGTLMKRFALTADQAFAVLQRYSQDNNIKLVDVAARYAATRPS